MSWTTFVTTLSTYITGQFGIALFGALIAFAGIEVKIRHSWQPIGWALAAGAICFSSAWCVTYFMDGA